jgi:hypothetical protein
MSKRLLQALRRFSPEDTPPETIALSVVLGVVLGVFPLYGVPTLLCVVAALLFRTHAPLLHATNAVTGPLQFALLFPFHSVGARLLPGLGQAAVSDHSLIARLGGAVAQTSAGWLLLCAPAGIVLYCIAAVVLRRFRQQTAVGVTIFEGVSDARMLSSMDGIS